MQGVSPHARRCATKRPGQSAPRSGAMAGDLPRKPPANRVRVDLRQCASRCQRVMEALVITGLRVQVW